MTFTEEWYSNDACAALAHLAAGTRGLDGRVVEIGCWEGRSTVAIANAVHPDLVHAVDTWKGSPGEISADLAKTRDVLATFVENISALTAGNVCTYRTDWRDYFNDHPQPIRFCHIDATHSYDEVAQNIDAVLPLLVDGGIICGDDAGHPPVRQAVLDRLGSEVNLAAGTLWWLKKGEPVSLASRYERACRTPSDIFEHLPVFVDLCQELDATNVIELGTRGGVSTIAWLYGLEGVGRLWSVDIDPAPELPYDHWTFLLGDDLDPTIVRQLPDSADIVFIDTSHTYEDTLSELNVYRWKVRPGGKIVLHDTELKWVPARTRQPDFPVKVAVEEFCNEENLTVQYLPNNNGLGIIDLPE